MTDYALFYEKLSQPFRQGPYLLKLLLAGNKLITLLIYALYLGNLAILLWTRDLRILVYVFVPGTSFVILSLIRKKLNRPRPYEAFPISPLMAKDTQGCSWPSRHVFSASLIAMATVWLNLPLGLLGLSLALLLAPIRVIAGVHYPRDVVAGYLFGLACGAICFLF